MKILRISILAIKFSFLFLTSYGQWSTDPQNPRLVCDAGGTQANVVSFSDGAGGAYVFWTDTRLNPGYSPKEIYGQHYNNEGYELWEPEGRLIMDHYNAILNFNIVRNNDGTMVLGMITKSLNAGAGDTLCFQMIDGSGSSLWADPLVVANAAADPNYILYITDFMVMNVNDEYYVNIGVIYYGGSNGNRFTKFDNNANLIGAYDGTPVGFQGYVGATYWDRTYDDSGDFYLFYATGNGAGAALHCFRFNGNGAGIWGPVDVTQGTSGLSYQLGGISDPSGITLFWQGSGTGGTDLFSRRLTPGGAFKWGGNTVNICIADGEQTNFHFKRKDQYLYVTWADGRPGVDPGYYDIYAQKLDTTGYFYWAPNGIEIASFNTYIPYPKLVILDDYSIIVDHQSTVAGFVSQKVSGDGSLPWDSDAKQLAGTQFNPFYQMHILFQSGDNTIAVWNKAANSGGSDGVYITRADEVQYASLPELESGDFTLYPNPAGDLVTVFIPKSETDVKISLLSMTGQIIESKDVSATYTQTPLTFNTSNLQPGFYIIRTSSSQTTYEEKLLIR